MLQTNLLPVNEHTISNNQYSNLNVDSEIRVEKSLLIVQPLLLKNIDINEVSNFNNNEFINYIKPIVTKILNNNALQLNAKEQDFLEKRLADDMLGLGPLEYLLADNDISDILVNGTNNIYVEKHGQLTKSHIKFRDNEQVFNIISRIVSIVGRRIDEKNPFVDARLKDGSRVNAIIPPLAIDGPCLSIRKFKQESMSLSELVTTNTLSASMKTLLEVAIQCRKNIIIYGGTGSGKTTLLNALSEFIPANERIVTIEDAAELQLQQEHLVRLETRSANIEGHGAITERQLLKNALRMRPDRIILGEIRGEEAFELLQAMNTGHDGSLSSMHASNIEEVASRLINMVLMAGFDIPASSILNQISNSIDILVEIKRLKNGERKITKIAEVYGKNEFDLKTSLIFAYQEDPKSNKYDFYQVNTPREILKDAKFYGVTDKLTGIL